VNLVFFDYSRFSRDTKRALQSFDDLDRLGVFSVSVCNPNIDCRTAGGRTARRDELSKAEDFSDQHSEKQQLRMKLALESGRWIAWAPLGYENVRTRTKGEPNIRPVEPAAGLVRQSFELMAAGTERPAAALRIMTDLGLRSRKGNKLTVDRFVQTLKNPAYVGGTNGPRSQGIVR
jgi:DNA invertase Pin-like site-specific DNA recombinase